MQGVFVCVQASSREANFGRVGANRRSSAGAGQKVIKAVIKFRRDWPCSADAHKTKLRRLGQDFWIPVRRCVTARAAWGHRKRRAGETRRKRVGATRNVSRATTIFVMIGHVPSMSHKKQNPAVEAGFWVPVRRCVTARFHPPYSATGLRQISRGRSQAETSVGWTCHRLQHRIPTKLQCHRGLGYYRRYQVA